MIYRILFRIKIALEILKGCNIVVCDNKKKILAIVSDEGCLLSNNINVVLATNKEIEEKEEDLYYKGEVD